MKQSQAKEYLPFVQAAAEGKTIQWFNGKEWRDVGELYSLTGSKVSELRIKPQPNFRPWKGNEFPPIGLYKNGPFIYAPAEYRLGEIVVMSTSPSGVSAGHVVVSSESLLKTDWLVSTDGGKTWKPCGVEIDGEVVS